MSPQVSAVHHDQETTGDLQRLRWAGWIVAGTVAVAWAGWLSLLAIDNSTRVSVVRDRQQSQYDQLREDIAEIKVMIRGQ